MKIKMLVSLFALMCFSIGVLFSATAEYRSDIVIEYTRSGWLGVNAGWEEDEWLISPNHTLDYPLNKTNRANPDLGMWAGKNLWKLPPTREENWGEQVRNRFSPYDCVIQREGPDGTRGDLSELWITWDTNWLYVAVKGEMRNGFQTGRGDSGVNLFVLFDRIEGFGVQDLRRKTTIWDKAIYTRDFHVDFYIGTYTGDESRRLELGAFQVLGFTNQDTPYQAYRISTITHQPTWDPPEHKPELSDAFYNGRYEFNTLQRVLLFRIRMDAFTNDMPSVKNINLRIIAASVDGSTGSGALTYDFMPDNFAGMNPDRMSVADNYFEIPFTDENGNLRMGVRPRYDAKIVSLPGSREFTPPKLAVGVIVSNTSSGVEYTRRRVFAPLRDEVGKVGIIMEKGANVFDGSISIFNLRGEKVRSIPGRDSDGTLVWNADADSETSSIYHEWDGTDDDGFYLPMGNYIVVFSGVTEDGLAWTEKSVVSILR